MTFHYKGNNGPPRAISYLIEIPSFDLLAKVIQETPKTL